MKDIGKAAVEVAQTLDTAFEHWIGTLAPWKVGVTCETAIDGRSVPVQDIKTPKCFPHTCNERQPTLPTLTGHPNAPPTWDRASNVQNCSEISMKGPPREGHDARCFTIAGKGFRHDDVLCAIAAYWHHIVEAMG